LSDESGRSIEVNFKGGLHVDSTAKFSTSDEKLQEALEKCSGFKRDFYLDSVYEDSHTNVKAETKPSANKNEKPSAKEDENKASGAVVKVADKADAVEWLKENHPDKGYTANKLRSEAAFTAACQECGVTFEFVG